MASQISTPIVAARHVVHLNLNTTDLDVSSKFYQDLLGLDLPMKSGSDEGDWRFHGIEEPVSSAGWFLYDDRGPRTSPALELVGWNRPATGGEAYTEYAHRGLGSMCFRVPSLHGMAAVVEKAGGTVVGPISRPGDTGEPSLLIRDTDGVFVELQAQVGADSSSGARLSSARIGCQDLDVSMDWYTGLGFSSTREPEVTELSVAGETIRLRSCPMALPSAAVELDLTQWLDPIASEPAEARLWHRGMVRMAASVDDLDAAIAALRAAGRPCPDPILFAMPGTSIGDGLRVLFLTDPDGLTVELVHRPPRHFAS